MRSNSKHGVRGLVVAAALSVTSLTANAADTGARLPLLMAQQPAAQATTPAPDRMDINTAGEAELATLPGIGEVRAKAIVKGRPYARKDELVKKNVLSEGVYEKIQDRVIAKQK